VNTPHDDFAFEPVPGLPEPLPRGERVLWRGAPLAWPLARDALHVRKAAVYFAILLAIKLASAIAEGATAGTALAGAGVLAALGMAAVALLGVIAILMARSTIYTITDRRVVMRFGIALPITVNVPFGIVQSVALRGRSGASGDLALALAGRDRIAWLAWWPHVRPWRIGSPQPMLRSLADPQHVATLLREALLAAGAEAARPVAPTASAPALGDRLQVAA
jgi:hypothetical protein